MINNRYFFLTVLSILTFFVITSLISEYQHLTNDVQYSIFIDAGSSGSRLHIFQITIDSYGAPLSISTIGSIKNKTALSSYSASPENAYESIHPLFQYASDIIPESFHLVTPIFIFSTAGMRLLPFNLQYMIYKNIFTSYNNDTFRFIMDFNHIKTIGGKEEAFFGWISSNYLANRFSIDLKRKGDSIGSLDLGGYSTQIVFEPQTPKLSSPIELDNLFMYSFLGYGGQQIRDRYIRYILMKNNSESPCDHKGYLIRHTSYEAKKLFGTSNYQECRDILMALLAPEGDCSNKSCSVFNVNVPQLRGEFYAMSLFFYSFDFLSKLYPKFDISNTNISTLDYYLFQYSKLNSKEIMSLANISSYTDINSLPERYFHISYIISLLKYGYKINDTITLRFVGTVNKLEVEWCLGAVLSLMHDITSTTSLKVPFHVHVLISSIIIIILIYLWRQTNHFRNRLLRKDSSDFSYHSV